LTQINLLCTNPACNYHHTERDLESMDKTYDASRKVFIKFRLDDQSNSEPPGVRLIGYGGYKKNLGDHHFNCVKCGIRNYVIEAEKLYRLVVFKIQYQTRIGDRRTSYSTLMVLMNSDWYNRKLLPL